MFIEVEYLLSSPWVELKSVNHSLLNNVLHKNVITSLRSIFEDNH